MNNVRAPIDIVLNTKNEAWARHLAELLLAFFGLYPRSSTVYPDMRQPLAEWATTWLNRPGRALFVKPLMDALVPKVGGAQTLFPRLDVIPPTNDGWVGIRGYGVGEIHFLLAPSVARLRVRVTPMSGATTLAVLGVAIAQQQVLEGRFFLTRELLERASKECEHIERPATEKRIDPTHLAFEFEAKDEDAAIDLAAILLSVLAPPNLITYRSWLGDFIVVGLCHELIRSLSTPNRAEISTAFENTRRNFTPPLESYGYRWKTRYLTTEPSCSAVSFSLSPILTATASAKLGSVKLDLEVSSRRSALSILGLAIANAAPRQKKQPLIASWIDQATALLPGS